MTNNVHYSARDAEFQAQLAIVAKAIARVQLNGGDPNQPAIRWNGSEMEPQSFPAWHDFRDEACAVLDDLAGHTP